MALSVLPFVSIRARSLNDAKYKKSRCPWVGSRLEGNFTPFRNLRPAMLKGGMHDATTATNKG